MNEKKIAFIICVNDELYFEECNRYIEQLLVPEGCEVDVLAIREADSMCAAYNAGMQSTDAKYKIYMHQDVMIRNRNFLKELLDRFEAQPRVGMIGVVGGTEIPETGLVFDAANVGKVDVREPDMAYYMHTDESIKEDCLVASIDGMLMATQYDLPWREDLFKHFDFYDVSQSCEFRRHGYGVLIPYQETPWITHDCGFAKLGNYGGDRDIFLKEYADMLTCPGTRQLVFDEEWDELSRQLQQQIVALMEAGAWNEAEKAFQMYRNSKLKSSGLEILNVMTEIWQAEVKEYGACRFFAGWETVEQMREWYISVRFALRRMELAQVEDEYADLAELLRESQISMGAIRVILRRSIVDRESVLLRLDKIFKECGNSDARMDVAAMLTVVRKMPLPVAYCKGAKRIVQ